MEKGLALPELCLETKADAMTYYMFPQAAPTNSTNRISMGCA